MDEEHVTELSRRWDRADVAARYATSRWKSSRRRERDANLLKRLTAQCGVDLTTANVLDVPCGTGRLRDLCGGRYLGVDSAAAMLTEARQAGAQGLVRADVQALPLRTRSAEVVIACRLLHHLADPADLARAVRELVRVSEGWVFASFWDAASLPSVRRRLRGRTSRETRVARTRAEIRAAFETAGARVTAFTAGPRFLSQQSFCAAQR